MGTPAIGDMMAAYAQDAEEFVRENFKVDLDYSEQSIEVVEAILGALHEQMPPELRTQCDEGSPPEVIDQFAKAFGGYLGEVMRRNWGGHWKDKSDAFPGELHYTLELATGGDCWPHYKAGKRIVNGAEDNVWNYFQYLKEQQSA